MQRWPHGNNQQQQSHQRQPNRLFALSGSGFLWLPFIALPSPNEPDAPATEAACSLLGKPSPRPADHRCQGWWRVDPPLRRQVRSEQRLATPPISRLQGARLWWFIDCAAAVVRRFARERAEDKPLSFTTFPRMLVQPCDVTHNRLMCDGARLCQYPKSDETAPRPARRRCSWRRRLGEALPSAAGAGGWLRSRSLASTASPASRQQRGKRCVPPKIYIPD